MGNEVIVPDVVMTSDEMEDQRIERRLQLMKPRERKKVIEQVENRINDHRKQEVEVMPVDRNIVGGNNKIGVWKLRRTIDEPERIESKYIVCQVVDDNGEQKALVVTLRVWADWKCQEAVAWNKGMVSRVCNSMKPKPMNFSTRMQTEVQTRSIVMWMRLHGQFFWNKNRKVFATSLHFDKDKQILRRIQTDDFKSWIMNHADVNMQKSDFEFLMHEIDAIALNPDVARECDPKALFDRRDIDGVPHIFISNGDSAMAVIGPSEDGRNVRMMPNGYKDVVFLNGATLSPWELLEGDGEDPFDNCPPFSTANYQSRFGKMLVRLWVLSLAACQRSFPAIVFTGKRRSGKSRTAKAVCELLGAPVRLASIEPGTSGKKDFWTVVNKGGVVCFDNVDTKIDWFSDAIQQACTDGSFESRALYSDAEVSTLFSNARIVLTSNNPLFFSESGISDRSLIIRLLPFDGKNGKQSVDGELSDIIASHRDAALTWICRTISRALADSDPVEGNVNFRHPDFANFALRSARALGIYGDAILALKSAEFDKSLMTVQNNTTVNYVFEALRYFFTDRQLLIKDEKIWIGTAGQMQKLIVESHPNLKREDGTINEKLCPNDVVIGKMMQKYMEDLAMIFNILPLSTTKTGSTEYVFTGFSEAYLKNYEQVDDDAKKQIDKNSLPF